MQSPSASFGPNGRYVMTSIRNTIFEDEVLPVIPELRQLALKYTHSEPEAEDLVQDSIIKAYDHFDSYQEGTNCKAWLFRILTNTFINRYRRKKREKDCIAHISQFVDKYELNLSPSSDIELADSYQNHIYAFSDEMLHAFESMPDNFRSIIILADVQEFSYKEISNLLQIPLGTVMSRLCRARQQLKNSFMNTIACRAPKLSCPQT